MELIINILLVSLVVVLSVLSGLVFGMLVYEFIKFIKFFLGGRG